MPTEKDYKVIEKATIYDLRRLFKNSDKATYTKEELCDLLDTIADAKDQESTQGAGEIIPRPFSPPVRSLHRQQQGTFPRISAGRRSEYPAPPRWL